MASKRDGQQNPLTLRDVALAALELDAQHGHDPVSWEDVVAKAKSLAAERILQTEQLLRGVGR